MPRIQILHLPAGPDDYPFALVLDELDELPNGPYAEALKGLKDEIGARAVLVFEGPVEIP